MHNCGPDTYCFDCVQAIIARERADAEAFAFQAAAGFARSLAEDMTVDSVPLGKVSEASLAPKTTITNTLKRTLEFVAEELAQLGDPKRIVS